jgi:hypothetical protein
VVTLETGTVAFFVARELTAAQGQRRFVARPDNVPELRDAARACNRTRLNGIRRTYRLSGNGLSLSGAEVSHAQQTVQGLPVEIAVTTTGSTGSRSTPGTSRQLSPGPKHARICDSPLRLRCTRDWRPADAGPPRARGSLLGRTRVRRILTHHRPWQVRRTGGRRHLPDGHQPVDVRPGSGVAGNPSSALPSTRTAPR